MSARRWLEDLVIRTPARERKWKPKTTADKRAIEAAKAKRERRRQRNLRIMEAQRA